MRMGDNFSGFVYSPDGTEPKPTEAGTDIVYEKQMNKYWFYISCT